MKHDERHALENAAHAKLHQIEHEYHQTYTPPPNKPWHRPRCSKAFVYAYVRRYVKMRGDVPDHEVIQELDRNPHHRSCRSR